MKPLDKIKQELRTVANLRGASSLLQWDQETYMPDGSGAIRAEQIALLDTLSHEKLVGAEISGPLSELLDQTMSLLFQVLNAERGVIFLYNANGELEPTISRSSSGGELPELTVSKTITQKSIDEKAAIITADAGYDPRFQQGASIVAYNIRSAICVPLWEKGRIRGAIYLDNLAETYKQVCSQK